MDLATGAMGSLLLKLADLLKEEYKLHKGMKKDVESLSREMKSMHTALRKVARVPRDQLDEQVKLWADDVRELSYEMEDVVDTFLVRVEDSQPTPNPDGFKGLIKRMFNLFNKGKNRHQIANAIKGIKDQVQDVASRRDRYRVDDVVANPDATTTVDPRLLALYKDKKDIIGIQEAMDEIIKMLADGGDVPSKQRLKIVSIFGSGGLGKTTLAKAVHDKLESQWDCRAFVAVGRNPDMKKVFRDTLLGLDKQKYLGSNVSTWDERQLIDELRELLRNKRYFIVIDDIWDTKVWEIIRCALMDSNNASRIIITTRIFAVGEKAGDVYKLQPLSRDNSEELFCKRLFGEEGKCSYDQQAKISEKILQKCGGVPLAIITIASLLAGKPREDWSKVYNSIGFGYGDNEDVESTRKILLFSYYDLPSYLRTCLLHLSIFPEDYLIWKETLIWKWVAEGLIQAEREAWLFEIGERYFNELINRSMTQPVEIPDQGIITGCYVHDMVLDMICSLSNDENFVTVLDGSEQHTSADSNPRRLAIQKRVIEQHDPLTNTSTPQVRSFNATLCRFSVMPPLSSFQVLRVLAIEDCTFVGHHLHYLKHIGRLLQLRYLGLPNNIDLELPEEIGDLRYLQTLDLRGRKIENLPQSVGQLRQLKCMRANGDSTRVPDWIGNLTSLEELWLSSWDKSPNFVKDLGKLRELRELKIRIVGFEESWSKALVESLRSLEKIQVLYIFGGGLWSKEEVNWDGYVPPRQLHRLHLAIKSSRLPAWIKPSLVPNLTHLYVVVNAVEAQDVEILGRFPELITLTLLVPVDVSLAVMGCGAFPMLRHLETSAPSRFLQGAMPRLESVKFYLEVRASEDDASFDFFDSLGNLPCLKKITTDIVCSGARATDVVAAEEAARRAANVHPNCPILHLQKF